MKLKKEEEQQQENLKRETEENRLRTIRLKEEKAQKAVKDSENAKLRGTQALKWHQREVQQMEQDKENLTQIHNKADIRQQEEMIAREQAGKF